MSTDEEKKVRINKDAFASVAIWQIVAFIALILFIWVNGLLDIPARVFGAEPTPFSMFQACMLTAAAITAAVICVGHTYEQQRSLLRKLLETCIYCHRVKTPEQEWEHVESYFIKHYPVGMDRSVCPHCQDMLEEVHPSTMKMMIG